MTSMRVEGLDDLSRRLRALPAKIQRVTLIKAVKAGAEPILHLARVLVPRRTGLLARSIRTKFIKRGVQRAGVQIGVFAQGSKKTKNQDPFYARFVEMGTSKMAARPFLRPAFETGKHAAVQRQAEVLKQEIDRAERL